MNPVERGDHTFAVLLGQEMIGFFTFNKLDQNTVEMGLGMRPDLTGQGAGLNFLKAGLNFVRDQYHTDIITLSVATFNQRAIKVYEKAGFLPVNTFTQDTNGGHFEFLKMVMNVAD